MNQKFTFRFEFSMLLSNLNYMTYKLLKEKLENLTDEQLNQQVAFEGAGLCGSVAELKTAQENWFCDDWAHPGMYLDTESRIW